MTIRNAARSPPRHRSVGPWLTASFKPVAYGVRSRAFIAMVCVAILPPLIVLPFELHQVEQQLSTHTRKDLLQVAQTQQRRINAALSGLEDQMALIASRTQMRIQLDGYNRRPEPEAVRFIDQVIADALARSDEIERLWVFGDRGQPVAGADPEQIPARPFDSPGSGSAHRFDMKLHWTDGDQAAFWARSSLVFDGLAIGTLVARIAPHSVTDLLADFPHPELIGESYIILDCACADGRYAVLSSQSRISSNVVDYVGGKDVLERLLAIPDGQLTTIDAPDGELTTIAYPLDFGIGRVYFKSRTRLISAVYSELLRSIALSLALATMLAVVISWWLAERIALPVRTMSGLLREFRPTQPLPPIDTRGWPTELKRLSAALNASAELIRGRTVALHSEIRRRRTAQRELSDLANTDDLTGLANRRHFMVKLREAAEPPSETSAAAGPCDLIYLDLDGFKPVNDRFGHDAGDAVLCTVAERIRYLVRDQDLAARLGGDEFAVLLLGIEQAEDSRAIAERIVASIEKPMRIGQETLTVGCSLGHVRLTENMDAETALRRADREMYRHKLARQGGGSV